MTLVTVMTDEPIGRKMVLPLRIIFPESDVSILLLMMPPVLVKGSASVAD